MTQDEIIEMARQAGFSGSVAKMWTVYFEAFAKLVAAKRTWVDLTDEDIKLVRHSFPSGSIEDLHSFARAVLDKSKEKNYGF